MSDVSCLSNQGAEAPKRFIRKRYRGDSKSALAFTVQEFCDAHRISRTTFYKLRNSNQGPRMSKVLGRVLIDREAADEWRRNQRLPDPVL